MNHPAPRTVVWRLRSTTLPGVPRRGGRGAGGLGGRGGVVSRSQQPSATTSSQQQPAAAASSTQQPAAAASSSSTQQQPTLGNGPPDILTGAHVCARSPVTHEFSTLLLQWHTPHVTPLSRRSLQVSVWRPAEQFHPVTAYYYCNPITGSELLRPPPFVMEGSSRITPPVTPPITPSCVDYSACGPRSVSRCLCGGRSDRYTRIVNTMCAYWFLDAQAA